MDTITQDNGPVSIQEALPPITTTFGDESVPTINVSDPTAPNADDNVPVINVTNFNEAPALTANGIQQKAKTLHYALQDKSPGIANLEAAVQANKENEIRVSLAFSEKYKQQQITSGIIRELIRTRQGEDLTPDDESQIRTLVQTAGNVDPETVVEKVWSNNYIRELMGSPSKLLAAGMAAGPVTAAVSAGTASKVVSTQQVALALKQKIDKRWEDTPILGSTQEGPDKLTAWIRPMLLPGSDLYLLHNVIEEAKPFLRSFLPGSNLKEIRDYLYLVGPERAKPLMEKAADYLWSVSPQAARKFVDAVVHYPSDGAVVDNIFGVVEVGTTIPGGWIARSLKGQAAVTRKIIDSSVPVKVSPEFVESNINTLFTHQQKEDLFKYGKTTIRGPGGRFIPSKGSVYELEKAAGAFPEDGSYLPSGLSEGRSVGSPEASRGIPEGTISGFKTSKGSTYEIGEGGVTTRNKAPRNEPGHEGDAGLKETSVRTIYVDKDNLGRFAVPDGASFRVFENKDGTVGVAIKPKDGKMGPTPESKSIPISTEPKEGLHPVELWGRKKEFGTVTYNNMHPGSEITELTRKGGYKPSYSYNLNAQFDTEAFKESTAKVAKARENLANAKQGLDEADEAGMAKAQDKIYKAQKEYDEALAARDSVSVYRFDPAINRASQGLKSYLSAGVQALKTAPTGNGTEIVNDLQATLTTLGRAEEAIRTGAMRRTAEMLNKTPSPDPAVAINSLGKDLPSHTRPNNIDEPNPSALTREGVLRMSEELQYNEDLLNKTLGGVRVQRLTEEDLAKAYNQTKVKVVSKYAGDFHNSVLDQEMIYNAEQNVYYVKTKLGKTDATGFADEFSARNTLAMQYGIPMKDFAVIQQGDSFYGFVLTPLDETGTIASTLIPTNNLTPSFMGESSFFKSFRSAADETSPLQMQARYIASHAPQRLNLVVQDIANSVKLTGAENKHLNMMLKQSELDFDAAGNKGVWWTPTKLEQEYAKRFGVLPSADLVKGYYTFKQLMDFDYAIRSNYVYSYWTRWGAENFSFKWAEGQSNTFMGKVVDKIDFSKQRDRGMLFIDEQGNGHYKWTNSQYRIDEDGFRTKVDTLVAENGYQIIELAQPLRHPVKDIKGGDIYYVVTRNAERTQLNPGDMLPYRGGPHVVYTHPHFIGQMKLSKDAKGQLTYNGDTTFRGGFVTEEAAKVWAIKYDTARKIMNTGDDAALADFLRNNLPEDVDSFKKLFTGEDALNQDLPIAYHGNGKNILDRNEGLSSGDYNGVNYNYGQYKDYFNDHSNPEQGLNAAFLQERANQAVMFPKDMGLNVPQRFILETAATLDPYISIQRGIGQAIRLRYMEDYKVLAAESYIKEFGKHIHNASPEALQRNPIHYLYEGQISTGTPHEVAGRMKAYQANVKNFIGMQSEIGQDIAHFEAKAVEFLTRRIGENATASLLEKPFVSEYLLPIIKDPASYARAAAFKLRLGLFNPVQYFQQGQAAVAVLAISPRAGMEGIKIASYLHTGGKWALDDPAKFDHYVNMISKSSKWTKDEAREVLAAYRDSGYGIVGSEASLKKNMFADPKLYQTKAGKWLDKGDLFFNAGEGFTRDTAFFTAYREWLDKNIGQRPNQYDLGEIVRRASDMNFNMTRAANSAMQSNSWTSIPLQFQTFRFRQMELMLGGLFGKDGRITRGEAASLWATYSVLYGIPTGTSAWAGYNFYEDIRVKAKEYDFNFDDNKTAKALNEGILAFSAYLATGKNLSVASSWGPGSSTLPKDVWDSWHDKEGAKTWAELLTGPTGSSIKAIYESMKPLARWGVGKITGEEYPLTPEDYSRFTSVAATTDNLRKAWQAYNLQQEFTRNGTLVGSATTWDGVLKAVFGLNNQDYQDSLYKIKSDKVIRGYQEDAKKEMRPLFQKAKEALAANELARAKEYMDQARVIKQKNGITDAEATQLYLEQGTQGLNDSVNSMLYRDPDATTRERRINRFLRNNP